MPEPMPTTPMSDVGLLMLLGELRGWSLGGEASDDAVRMNWLMLKAAEAIDTLRDQAKAFAIAAASEKTAALATARAEEREACAKVAERLASAAVGAVHGPHPSTFAMKIAAAIRSR